MEGESTFSFYLAVHTGTNYQADDGSYEIAAGRLLAMLSLILGSRKNMDDLLSVKNYECSVIDLLAELDECSTGERELVARVSMTVVTKGKEKVDISKGLFSKLIRQHELAATWNSLKIAKRAI